MSTIVTIEVVCAVFVGLLLTGQFSEYGNSKSSKYLRLSTILVIVALIIDILAYVCLDPGIPLAFRYIICLFAYANGGIIALAFIFYSEAYFAEKMELNPWIFRIAKLGAILWVTVTAIAFILGQIIVYENGLEAADYGFPLYVSVIQILVQLYTLIVIAVFRKKIGGGAVLILAFLNAAPLCGTFASLLVRYDYTYVFATIAITLVTELLQRRLMEIQRKELERDRIIQLEKETELSHTEFRAAALAHLVDNEGDITSFLNFFAEQLRELVGCDQVVYRGHKGNMFINNAPELGDEYAVPIDICHNCPHYDMFGPVYAEGVAEMYDAQKGINGIRASESCPVKSALTRIVYLDGNVNGYLALHYILDYHEFTDYERQTLEEFTNLLSILLSRYAAREKNEELTHELELKRQIEEQKEQLEKQKDQLEEQQKKLEEAIVLAKSANEAKTAFLFNMSHDIRTPMNAIKGFTSMAKKNVGDKAKVVEYLNKIDISGEQLLTLINEVLEMARIESGKVELEESPVNVTETFNSLVTVLSEQARNNGLKFAFTLGNIEHNNVFADEARIGSITLNIIGNAMKYTPKGGSVVYELKEVPSRKPGYATFVWTVADTGIGMSKEYLKEIYEPFSREKSSTVSKIQGTGLGLSIVKHTVDLMGGDINVWSELGKGTKFEITLDFKIDDKSKSSAVEPDIAADASFNGRRVLLVEDNEMNREIATYILEEAGLKVEDADDGDVALAKVRAAAARHEYNYYDFILMDVQMPRMNGYEATKAIRAIDWPQGVHVPIIAMTANAFEEDRQNALKAGMDDHLAKPIDVKKLFATLAKYIK